uniref:Acyl-ACP thioesterase n=1 Tax=Tanacetum cinerariifolium TaxID=118510 RepID=A0A699HS92_TANCI|nr:acyl-ACP thioesterase [Tanacetum cinerariifolium]
MVLSIYVVPTGDSNGYCPPPVSIEHRREVIQVYGKLCLETYIAYVFLSYETLFCSKILRVGEIRSDGDREDQPVEALAMRICNRVCQWVKEVENEIFMLGGALSPGDHSASHEVVEKYELASFPLEYCRKCRNDSVLKLLTSILGGGDANRGIINIDHVD